MMKKQQIVSLVAMLLALVMMIAAIPVGAAELTATFMVEGETAAVLKATDGKITLPDTPTVTVGTFVGWAVTIDGQANLYPAGAVVEGITESLTFSSFAVRFSNNTGASVRLRDGDVGLRFTSDIVKEDFDTLRGLVGKENVSFGTYIVPLHYLFMAGMNFTLEALQKAGYTKYVDVPATGFYHIGDTAYTIAGSVSKIKDANYSLDYTGTGYLKVTYANGDVKTIYADYNWQNNYRNIYGVILAAYEDRNESYDYVINSGIYPTHSPYTPTQLDLMKKFLDAVAGVEYNAKYEFYATSGIFYTSPWQISYTEDANKRGLYRITITPPEGKTLDDLKAVSLDKSYRSMAVMEEKDGTLIFTHDSYTKPY